MRQKSVLYKGMSYLSSAMEAEGCEAMGGGWNVPFRIFLDVSDACVLLSKIDAITFSGIQTAITSNKKWPSYAIT